MAENTSGKFTYKSIKETASAIRTIKDRIEMTLDQIEDEMESTETKASFKGQAAESIREKFNTMKSKSYPKFEEAIEAYAKFLDDTYEIYQTAENTISTYANDNLV